MSSLPENPLEYRVSHMEVHNSSVKLHHRLKKLNSSGCQIFMEVPTSVN